MDAPEILKGRFSSVGIICNMLLVHYYTKNYDAAISYRKACKKRQGSNNPFSNRLT